MSSVVHITPELQPTIGGVADYVAILAKALEQRGTRQGYLVAGHAASEHKESIQAKFPAAHVLEANTSIHLWRGLMELQAETVLLHYSPYGYERRGMPFRLAEGLDLWKRSRDHHTLTIMFHETWADGRLPWQSVFWTSGLQRFCTARIARLADAAVTNTSFYRSRLEPFLRPNIPIHVLPIFSNVGEPDSVPTLDDRDPICVLFGRGDTRRRTYKQFERHFDRLRELGIERLIEIGAEPEMCAGLEWPFPTDRLGPLEAAEISSIMLRARYGLFECPAYLAGKSGVLAALAGHGILPIHPNGEGRHERLEFGRDVVNISAVGHGSAPYDPASASAWTWYRKHCLDRQVEETWLRLLSPS